MRFAILGLGSAGSRHARNLVELGHDVAGFDPGDVPTPDGMPRFASQLRAIRWADAVVVASPSARHAAQAIAALQERRHVLIEKPLASRLDEAAALRRAAAVPGLVSAVAMNLRFHPALERLKALLDEQELGRPQLAEAVCGYDLRLWRPPSDYRESYSARSELGGGIVLDAVHRPGA